MKSTGRVLVFLLLFVTGFASASTASSEHRISTNADKKSFSSVNIQQRGSISGQGKETKYINDEFIIKFKSMVQEDMATAIKTNSVKKSSLAALNKRYRIKGAAPLFKQRLGKTTVQASRDFQSMIEKVKTTFPQRAKRIPKGVRTPDLSNIYVLKVEEGVDISDAVREYSNDPNVEYAEPNYIAHVQMIPNDPYYSSSDSWGQGYDDLWGIKKIQSAEAWDISRGQGIVIAVVDTGIDYNHPDITANIWKNSVEIPDNGIDDDGNGYIDDFYGYDFAYYDNDPMDGFGHGTHCAGTIAAEGNNNIGVIGVAHKANVMTVKALGDDGYGSDSNLAEAIIYAANNGADVISNSWGNYSPSQVITDAVNYSYSMGCVVLAAAGNDNSDVKNFSPAGIPNVIAVAASDHNDQKSDFSNYGIKIDVSAPGGDSYNENDLINYTFQNILSLRAAGTDMYGDGVNIVGADYYRSRGTSMACPHAAGLAGLILAKNPYWTPEEVRRILKQGVDPVVSDYYIGTGRINAYKALQIDAVADAMVSITDPESGSSVSGRINIKGTASDDDFVSYSLYYGKGANPSVSVWNHIYTSTTPVEDNILYADFNTGLLDEDENYMLKLVVVDVAGLTAEAISAITINNIQITTPLSRDIFKAGAEIDINGTIQQGDSFVIEYGEGETPVQWLNDGIILTNGGILPVTGNTLAVWDTSSVTTGYYTLRITVNNAGKQVQEFIRNIYLDTTLRTGWPQTIPWFFQPSDPVISKLSEDKAYIFNSNNELVSIFPKLPGNSYRVMDSFNGDKNEVITFHNNKVVENKSSYIVSSSATSQLRSTAAGYYYWPGDMEPVIADVNNDGRKEIFVYTGGNPPRIYAFKDDGGILEGWPVDVEGADSTNGGASTIADIDNDGYGEIIVGVGHWSVTESSTRLYAYNHDGSFLRSIEIDNSNASTAPITEIVVADLNHDGNSELIKKYPSSIGHEAVVMDSSGNVLPGWPRTTYDMLYGSDRYECETLNTDSSPAVVDIDNDGVDEVVVADRRNVFDAGFDPANPYDGKWHCEGKVYVFKIDGSDVPGFPKDIDGSIFDSPVIADINLDNYDEIIVNSGTFFSKGANPGVYVFDKSGNILNGWPRLFWDLRGQASVGDVDNDGYLEIATIINSSYNRGAEAYLFDYHGNVWEGWPQNISDYDLRGGIIGDITGDNFLDMIACAGDGFYPSIYNHGGLYAWDRTGLLLEGFPKVTETWCSEAAPTITDLNNDGKIELVASSNQNFDGIDWKYIGSIYVWDLDTPYNPLRMDWPMVGHDPQHTGRYTSPASILGDVNNDGKVDISDVILVLRIALAVDNSKPCSDINADSMVDISDVILTLRVALGLDPTKPCV